MQVDMKKCVTRVWMVFQENDFRRDRSVKLSGHHIHWTWNTLNFYLWGYLKDNMYQYNPQTTGELMAAITAKISEILREECVQVIENFARHMQVCLQGHGGYLEHILERTWLLCEGTQYLKLWGMIVHWIKFKTCTVLEVYLTFVGFNTIFMDLVVFEGRPVLLIR